MRHNLKLQEWADNLSDEDRETVKDFIYRLYTIDLTKGDYGND